MGQIQYIGARYVPIWYVNSVDQSANWEINVEYEPLTWVTTPNNHLYLSKKTVPDNIGTPAQNTEYWLDMGVFSGGQMADLEERVSTIEDVTIPAVIAQISTEIEAFSRELTQCKYRNVIAIGDSWGSGQSGETGWCGHLENIFNGDNIYTSASGGYAWTRSSLQFISLLRGVSVPDPDKIDLIIVAGGINEQSTSSTQADIEAAMKALVDYAETTYPNALVVGVGLNASIGWDAMDVNVRMAGACANGYKGKFVYVDYTKMIPPAWYKDDGVHLTPTYYKQMAGLINNIIVDKITTNATLDNNWRYTVYQASGVQSGSEGVKVGIRSVNGHKQVSIQGNVSDHIDFTTNYSLGAAITYINFNTVISGIHIITKLPLPFNALTLSTSSGSNFDGIWDGSWYTDDLGSTHVFHIDFARNSPSTVNRIYLKRKVFDVDF